MYRLVCFGGVGYITKWEKSLEDFRGVVESFAPPEF